MLRKLSFASMLIGMALALNYSALAIPTDDLVLHYDFAGGSVADDVAKDLSGNGYDGTISGGTSEVVDGLEFDGSDGYVGSPALEVRTGDLVSFTAFCWFKTEEENTGPLWMWGDNANPSSSGGAEAPVGWRSSTGNFAAGFYQGGHFYADSDEKYLDGEWHFVAQVGDEGTGYLYVDGQQISSTTAGYVYAGPPYFLIGVRTKNSGNEIDDVEYFSGIIGQIAVYSEALSEADISAIADEGMAVAPAGKLATTWGQAKE